jgi:hypothetical protein
MGVLLAEELGMERFAREVLVLLAANLDTELDTQDAKWNTLDEELAIALGKEYIACASDKVLGENYVMGHKPSLIEAPIEKYPNIAVMSYESFPSSDQGDQYFGVTTSLFVETMVIDGPYKEGLPGQFSEFGEDLVNRKVQRMTEAINAIVAANRTLGGVAFEIGTPPRVRISDCFRRKENTGSGADYYWQMARLEYTINKIAAY